MTGVTEEIVKEMAKKLTETPARAETSTEAAAKKEDPTGRLLSSTPVVMNPLRGVPFIPNAAALGETGIAAAAALGETGIAAASKKEDATDTEQPLSSTPVVINPPLGFVPKVLGSHKELSDSQDAGKGEDEDDEDVDVDEEVDGKLFAPLNIIDDYVKDAGPSGEEAEGGTMFFPLNIIDDYIEGPSGEEAEGQGILFVEPGEVEINENYLDELNQGP